MAHRFTLIDVFTEHAFGGNQLAVFAKGEDVPERLMQPYARELNFSETTFVLPPRKPGHTHRVRIFTPHRELPFAGHPNIGTGVVLAALAGRAGKGNRHDFVFDEDVGTVNISASHDGTRGFAELTLKGAAEMRPCDAARATLARMVSLPDNRLGAKAPWLAKAGISFAYIPLDDFDAVASARFDTAAWAEAFPPDAWTREIYAIAGDYAPGGRIKARMWGPSVGVAEDPATGSAAGILASSLAASLPDPEGTFTWTVEQGAEIGRPSVIKATAEKRGGQVIAIRVGGPAVIVGEGSLG